MNARASLACRGVLGLSYAAVGGGKLIEIETEKKQWAKLKLPEWAMRPCGAWQCATAALMLVPPQHKIFQLALVGSSASVGAVIATWASKQKHPVPLSTSPEPATPLAINTALGVATAFMCTQVQYPFLGIALALESFLAGGITILCDKWVIEFLWPDE